MLRIDAMTKEDTAFASELAEEQGWAHRQSDFLRLIDFEPEGCFVAWKEEKAAGMVTTTSYGDYAFLGCLIVRQEERGKGLGKALMEAAIKYISERGVKTIELDSVFPAVELYRKLGFKDKYLCLIFKGKGEERRTAVASYQPEMAERIISFDKEMTGIDRGKVLGRLLKDFQNSVLVMGEKKISAYAVAKPRSSGFFALGPFIAENREVAEQLLFSIMDKYSGRPLAVAIPELNRDAADLLLRNGFVHLQPTLRMYLGERRDYHQHVYGIIAPEKG